MLNDIKKIIQEYGTVIKIVDKNATSQEDRAYGGVIRSVKGKLQEYITEELVKIAWKNLGADISRLEINSKKIKIPILLDYIENLQDNNIKNYIKNNIDDYYYNLSVDKHIFVDDKFIMGIECKAYTENAMIKRILVDFQLLKTIYPDISCHLFQLESQLGGDYSALNKITYGAKPTHSIMSYFPKVDLHITTFLQGERNIDKPIHKIFKPLNKNILKNAVIFLQSFLKRYK